MECSKVMIATQANIKVKLMKLVSIILFISAIMLMTTAILFAVQIRTDFFSNRVVTNIFGSQVGFDETWKNLKNKTLDFQNFVQKNFEN